MKIRISKRLQFQWSGEKSSNHHNAKIGMGGKGLISPMVREIPVKGVNGRLNRVCLSYSLGTVDMITKGVDKLDVKGRGVGVCAITSIRRVRLLEHAYRWSIA